MEQIILGARSNHFIYLTFFLTRQITVIITFLGAFQEYSFTEKRNYWGPNIEFFTQKAHNTHSFKRCTSMYFKYDIVIYFIVFFCYFSRFFCVCLWLFFTLKKLY